MELHKKIYSSIKVMIMSIDDYGGPGNRWNDQSQFNNSIKISTSGNVKRTK